MNNEIALSFDLEDWYHTPTVTGLPSSQYSNVNLFFQSWEKNYDYITNSTIHLLEILNKYRLKVTFFVVADIIEKYPVIVNALKNSHHEIACHSLHHQIINKEYRQNIEIEKKNWESELIEAKLMLENTFQQEVIGYRAPSAYFSTWMIEILERLGFKYDSSISYNSLYNKTNVKLRNIPSYPYFLNNHDLSDSDNQSNIMELPWSSYHFLKGIVFPAGGAFFFRLLGFYYFKMAIEQCLNKGDTMFYLHPLDITREKLPINNSKTLPFYWINQGKRTERRLVKLLSLYKDKFVICKEIYEKNKEELD